MTMESKDLSYFERGPICHSEYQDDLFEKINVGRFNSSSDGFHQSIIDVYKKWGVAHIDLVDVNEPRTEFETIAREFGFKSAYVPSVYSDDDKLHDDFGINKIGKDEEISQNHRGFLSNKEQAVHVDGTLEPIGNIPTTMMLCQSQGARGGETRVFNAVGAFCRLVEEEPKLAKALISNRALTRRSVDFGGKSITGPVFDTNEYGLVNRFSLDNTSNWNTDDVENLKPALEWMEKKLTVDSDFYSEFRLKSGSLLIVANHKISHGRNAYVEKRNDQRRLFRAIFDSEVK